MADSQQPNLFGKTENPLANWTPPPIPPDLSRQGFLVGTSGYYFDDWVGLFNPPKLTLSRQRLLSQEQMENLDRLKFYQKYFRFVELNTTFYSEPAIQTFVDIERRSRENSLYTVKVNRKISHTDQWNAMIGTELMQMHVNAVSPLVETGRFYSFLIQLDDHNQRSMEKLDYLCAVAQLALKKRLDVHVELRHNSWHNEYVLQRFKDTGVGICNTEIPPVPHAFPLKSYATTDKGYIRYSGKNLANWYPKGSAESSADRTNQRNMRYDYLYSDEEVRERVEGQLALAKKTSCVAVAYNNHFKIQAILNAILNLQILKMRLGIVPG